MVMEIVEKVWDNECFTLPLRAVFDTIPSARRQEYEHIE